MPSQFSTDAKLPPQNIEAEQSLLGCLMIDKDAIIKIADFVSPKDFYKESHKEIFEAILALYDKREPLDILSITNKLEEMNKLDQIGGASYLTSLVNCVPTSSHVAHYAKITQKKSLLRNLISAASNIAEMGYNETEDIDELLDKAQQAIFGISQNYSLDSFTHVKPILEEAFDRIDEIHKESGKLRGIPTGFAKLDNKLAGLQKANLVILAARPSIGKTTLALDIARHVAVEEKVPVGIFSLEMSKDEIIDKLMCAQGQVSLWKLRTGKLSSEGDDNDFARISHAMANLSESPIYIDDSASSNVMQMRTMARRLQSEKGLGLLIVDYLQLMQGNGRAESRTQEVSEISRSLKSLARELNIPIIALSQLSRAIETRGGDQLPRLSDLRESGSIEQDADLVAFIHREDKIKKDSAKKNIAKIIIAKHRNGPVGEVELYFDQESVSFKNLDSKYEDEYEEQARQPETIFEPAF